MLRSTTFEDAQAKCDAVTNSTHQRAPHARGAGLGSSDEANAVRADSERFTRASDDRVLASSNGAGLHASVVVIVGAHESRTTPHAAAVLEQDFEIPGVGGGLQSSELLAEMATRGSGLRSGFVAAVAVCHAKTVPQTMQACQDELQEHSSQPSSVAPMLIAYGVSLIAEQAQFVDVGAGLEVARTAARAFRHAARALAVRS